MEVTYTLTTEDLVKAGCAAFWKSRSSRITYVAVWVAVPILGAAASAALFYYCEDWRWQAAGLFPALFGFLFAAIYPAEAPKGVVRRIRSALNKIDLRGITGRITLILTEESLTEITEVTKSEARWADMLGAEEVGENYTIIRVTSILSAILPRLAFESDEQYRAVRDFALARIKPRETA